MTTLTYTETLEVHHCPTCGTPHGVPADLVRDARADHRRSVYCPRGHSWVFSGKTEEQKAKERAAELERRLAREEENRSFYQQQLRSERAQHTRTKNQLAGTKGELTKTRKRAVAAVCPVDGCGRSFVQMRRHLAAKHPEVVG